MRVDTDMRPVSVDCVKRPSDKEPNHVSCAPKPYISPLVWDGMDNTLFRPVARVFAVDPPYEAVNVNAFDEVADSAWFQARIANHHPSTAEFVRGACRADEMLDPTGAPPGSWVIDQGKENGMSPGFRIRVNGKRKYMIKSDLKDEPERPSAAAVIGAAIYHWTGFNTSCEQVIFIERSILKLTPGLVVTGNVSGIKKPFNEAALDGVFGQSVKNGTHFRFQASSWLPGFLLGPFKYEKTRGDDPNDIIPHEDRRELRGARLVAAWINHFDAREQNTMDSWIAADSANPESSPGFVRHYYLDTSDSLGSEWSSDGISKRLGRSYLLDWGDVGYDFVTLGIPVRPWERVERKKGFEMFGFFSADEFEPASWKNEYSNPAFGRATERDNAWMARILSRFDRPDIDQLAGMGKFAKPEATKYLADILEARLRIILDRFLLRLSPLSDLRVEGKSLCGMDLARRRQVLADASFVYHARASKPAKPDAPATDLAVTIHGDGDFCLNLPASNVPDGVPDDAPERYSVIKISNGAARYPLRAYLYDLGARGQKLVGIERLEEE